MIPDSQSTQKLYKNCVKTFLRLNICPTEWVSYLEFPVLTNDYCNEKKYLSQIPKVLVKLQQNFPHLGTGIPLELEYVKNKMEFLT